MIKSYNFLTLKPFVYALNISQDDIAHAEELKLEFEGKLHAPVAVVCVKIEEEMMRSSNTEKLEFLAELLEMEVAKIPTLDDLITLAFTTL